MTLTTRLYTLFNGKLIGKDQFGNRYFENTSGKRWVLYSGKAEPSKVPPQWHGWLHYTLKEPPRNVEHHAWERAYMPNLTGTQDAYAPPGHLSRGAKRASATADYEPWQP